MDQRGIITRLVKEANRIEQKRRRKDKIKKILWNKEKYEKIVYNSTNISDFILDIYDSDEIVKIQSREKIINEICI